MFFHSFSTGPSEGLGPSCFRGGFFAWFTAEDTSLPLEAFSESLMLFLLEINR
ncbi:hypothetical protein SynA1562_01525 [Synechococcus sp. A15-62]|nr:hypothetical protein SynA1562_01525 [Synechococcus sp. A15-62]